jgi:hypothetical protein
LIDDMPIGAGLSRDIATGEKVEAELDAFIAKRHRERVATEGERDEEAAWAESARRLLAKQAEDKRVRPYVKQVRDDGRYDHRPHPVDPAAALTGSSALLRPRQHLR